MTSCSRTLRLGRLSVPFRNFLRFFVFLFFLTILRFCNLILRALFPFSRVTCVGRNPPIFSMFPFLPPFSFECSLLASEENEERIKKFHCLCCYKKHVQNLHIYPTHPPFSFTSRSLIRARTILASGNQWKEKNCACFLRALPKLQSFCT